MQQIQNLSKSFQQTIISPLSIYYITIDNYDNALKLSTHLVQKKLAACSNIVRNNNSQNVMGTLSTKLVKINCDYNKIILFLLSGCGVTSVYEWENKIETSEEILMIIKSRTELLEEICREVKANHPYDVPEVISTPILGGNKDYIDWVFKNTKNPELLFNQPQQK